jgi:hypothetical protein
MAALDRIGSSVGGALAPARAIADPLLLLPKLVFQLASDVNSIAASTRTLTVAVGQLDSISERVESLDAEVARMRTAVEAIGGDVDHMRGSVEPLGNVAARLGRRRARRTRPETPGGAV